MSRFEELAGSLEKLDGAKRGFVLSLLSDFVYYEEQIEKVRKLPLFTVDPKNPRRQKKYPAHGMLKDYQAQKNDIAAKILRAIDGEVGEESPLAKALARFNE